MNIRNLFTDDDAVSPVIGVILMVAITVILAAVIGAFVLDLGGSQEKAPQVSWSFEYDEGSSSGFGTSTDEEITVSHDGGDDVSSDSLSYTVGGTEVGTNWVNSEPSEWTAGTSAAIDADAVSASSGDSVQIIWQSSSGDSSSIIGEGQVP